jgi:HlyD family secretion protein
VSELLSSWPAEIAAGRSTIGPRDRGPIFMGVVVAGAFVGGFGGWAALAPLSSAAVGPGEVRVESHSKTVQHMEGGIIREILVREGDQVQQGQLLLRIDDTQAAARLAILSSQSVALKALERRLLAERDGLQKVIFPADLESQCAEPAMRPVCAGQEKLFEDRRRTLQGQTDILNRRIDQLHSEMEAREAQVVSLGAQLRMTADEIRSVEPLVKQQLLPRPRLLNLQRQAAALDGNRGEERALIAKAEQAIGEAQIQITDLVNKHQTEVGSMLRETQDRLADIGEKRRAAADVMRRTDVVAPEAGKIVNLRFFTIGGVVKAGDPILEIVPQNDKLIIQSEIRPLDIEAVHRGLPAEVRLTAYKQRRTPSVHGTVTYVSADRIVNERSGQSYYRANIEIDSRELVRLDNVKLYPGMPALVLITTGERTLMQYLLDPIRDSFARAFREK